MLHSLELRHFKCFEEIKLPFGSLTLLSGSNASGKSSVLQALVLLHQTMREHEWSSRLMLNGSSLQLGTVLDVVDSVHGRREFDIGLNDADATLRWRFSGDREEMSLATESLTVNGQNYDDLSSLRHLVPPEIHADVDSITKRLSDLTYITAERVGPRDTYALEDRQVAQNVGPRGEHTLSVLHRIRDEKVRPEFAVVGVAQTGLRQVEARMQSFFKGCRISLQQVPQANVVTLGIRTSDDTKFLRPVNVGFGLTQVLPIIVSAVAARANDVLLIENPEVHLHPAGQAQMGRFLAELSATGVQVIVESHSDHVLNGIRRTVRSGSLQPSQVRLHFFRTRGDELDQVTTPTLDSNGGLDSWPEGFFDQFDRDLTYLAGWSS